MAESTPRKTVLITGANSGIGLASAKLLAEKGWNVYVLVRRAAAAEAVMAELKAIAPSVQTGYYIADLSDLKGVQAVAAQILKDHPKLDVLLNNAGYYPNAIEYVDGIEKTLYASHLGHMLLTLWLMPALEAAPEARVVNVSSAIHMNGKVERFFLQPSNHSAMKAYADAKLANILFTMGLQPRLAPNVTTYSLHPGVVSTNFASTTSGFMGFMVRLFGRFLMSPVKGAATSVYLVTEPIAALKPHVAKYFDKCRPAKIRSNDATEANANWLWDKSMEILKPWLPPTA